MKHVIYSKYNYNRNPRFQTRTVLCEEQGLIHIEKSAVIDAAGDHISSFESKYEKVKDVFANIELLHADVKEGRVVYPFLKGTSIYDYLKERVHSWTQLFEELRLLIDRLYVVSAEHICDFKTSTEFVNMFGRVDCTGMPCVNPCNLDVIFDNIVINEDGSYQAYDYEWVCDCAVPQKYVIYRVLCNFYDKYFGYISPKYSFEEYIGQFDFSEQEKSSFRSMEDAFIRYVYEGGNPVLNSDTFHKPRVDFERLKQKNADYDVLEDNYNNAVLLLHDTEKQYKDCIEELGSTAERYREECDRHQNTLSILHDTEDKYLNSIAELDKAAKLYMSECDKTREVMQQLDDKNSECARLEGTIRQLIDEKTLMLNSFSWKITKPARLVKRGVVYAKNNGLKSTLVHTKEFLHRRVSGEEAAKLKGQFVAEYELSQDKWKAQRETQFARNVKVSIATPLFNTPEKYLIELLESLKNQSYENWELCMVNFGDSNHAYVDEICRKYADKDSRFVYHVAKENKGISENTNECISYATGEYIGLLDHDDVLHQSAIYEVVKRINETDCDFVYTDEIKFEEDIALAYAPNFKPDFSRYELYAHNFICHFNVYAKSLYDEVGGYRKEFDGSQDHDIVLRITEKAKRIEHIDKILYFWRVHEGSVALNIGEKPYATRAGERAVTEQVMKIDPGMYAESIINNIPCYRLKEKNSPQMNYSVILWGDLNDSDKLKTAMEAFSDDVRLLCESKDGNLDWNSVVGSAKYDAILVLHNSLSDISEDFACQSYMYLINEDVASVDAKVLDANGTILSGGLYVTEDEGMPFKIRCMGGSPEYYGYESTLLYARPVSASLGYCTFIKKPVWERVYDEKLMHGAGAIAAYSYLANKSGKQNIWTSFIQAKATSEALPQETIRLLTGLQGMGFAGKDIYVNDVIFKYGLE